MTNMTREDWMTINQNCLIAEVNVVKAKVLSYKKSLADNKNENDNALIDKAILDLNQIEQEFTIKTRLQSLVELFQLSQFEKNILLLCVGIELDASLGKLIAKVQENVNSPMPTISFVLSLFEDAHWSAITPDGALRYWQLINLNKNDVLTSSSFNIDELILHYLTGIDSLDSRLIPFISVMNSNAGLVASHRKLAEEITGHLSNPSHEGLTPIIQLHGNSKEDQKAIISTIFTNFNLTAYYLPLQLLPTNFQELTSLVKLWNREVMLNQYVLFLDGSDMNEEDQIRVNHVKYLLGKISGIVIISTEYRFTDIDRLVQNINVDKPLREEQELLWKEQLGSAADNLNGELGGLVTQFNLDSHSISHLAQKAVANTTSKETIIPGSVGIKEELWSSCCNYTRPNLSSLAQRIEAIATWDDLVLPAAQKDVLKEICIHVQHRQKVYYDWGFSSKSNRGLGISALFAGESGTGKTMASEVIANALNLDLYRVDLSQVINKYIGETEKNLKKIFDAAEDSGAILLFDEADALFGKRSEVKDSHDRHSNIEVSYLLQKMEEYRGLAILTTNMRSALDTAFLRRIRFVIQFPFPDAQMRSEIWNRIFPNQTPTKDLSIHKLANLNVAGGNIRNIALNATFAAANKNQPVSMLDIHYAAKNEYVKLEKHMSPSESLI